MANTMDTEGRNLTKHGVLMIGLGTALCAMGSLMAKPTGEEIGYVLAAALSALCLLIVCISLVIQENRALPQLLTPIHLVAGVSSIVCCLVFWLIQSASIDLRLLCIFTGLMGLFWGFWYMRLAVEFQSKSIKALVLCGLAGATSSIGIVLVTRSGLSKLSSVATCGCYMIALGVQIYLTAAFLYREHARAQDY